MSSGDIWDQAFKQIQEQYNDNAAKGCHRCAGKGYYNEPYSITPEGVRLLWPHKTDCEECHVGRTRKASKDYAERMKHPPAWFPSALPWSGRAILR